jgi:hypothetical protein
MFVNMEVQESIALTTMFQAYKEQIKAIVNGSFKKNKKICVANIIVAGDYILLLRRSTLMTSIQIHGVFPEAVLIFKKHRW